MDSLDIPCRACWTQAGVMQNRQDMERAVNKNPNKDHGDLSDSSSAVDFPPQTMVTWLLVYFAIGLVTIYTMIQFISNKLTKKIKGKKTEGQKNTTDLYSQSCTKQNNTNYDLKTAQDNSEKSEERGKVKENGSDLAIQDGSLNTEKPDFNVLDALENGNVERLETNISLVSENAMRSTKCQNNEASVHMGAGFSGNLSIETDAEKIEELTCDERSKIAAVPTTTCRSTAMLEDYDINYTPVTVNNVQLKCFSCSAEIPRNNEATIHQDQHNTDASNRHSTTCIPEVTKNLNGIDLEDRFRIKNNIDCGDDHPPSTINCIQTAVKCLNCGEASSLHMQKDCKKSNENSQSSLNSNDCGVEESSNPCQTKKDEKVNASEISLQNLDSKDSHVPAQLDHCVENNAATKTTSESSVNFLSNYHTPRDTTDGLVISKNTTEDDQFMSPQDYETTTERERACVSNSVEELETPRSRYLKSLRNDPVFSKSLDSQMEVLKKGCKLLETKPLKSSLRSVASSEGNLGKFVHFPEDIRNIRTVHKYISFDELWRCADAEESAEKQRTQSLDN